MNTILRAALVAFVTLFSSTGMAQQDISSQPAVLVTGATSGIGLRITERLAADGVFVYAGARKQADMDRLNRMDNVQAVRLDVTDPDDIAAAVTTIAEAGRGLYGVVNNAGVANIGPMIEQPEADVQFLFDVNVFGVFRTTQAFAPMVIDSKGRIVNISSISGVLSGTFFGAYSMSKHAIEAYTDSLAAEMRRFDVHVAAVEPGNYSSDIGRNMLQRMEARGFDIDSSRFADDLRRMLQGFEGYEEPGEFNPEPDDVAEAVQHALFDKAPKDHYMVVPYERQAEITIRKAVEEVVRYNEGQKYSYDRDGLIEILDDVLNADADAAGGAE